MKLNTSDSCDLVVAADCSLKDACTWTAGTKQVLEWLNSRRETIDAFVHFIGRFTMFTDVTCILYKLLETYLIFLVTIKLNLDISFSCKCD